MSIRVKWRGEQECLLRETVRQRGWTVVDSGEESGIPPHSLKWMWKLRLRAASESHWTAGQPLGSQPLSHKSFMVKPTGKYVIRKTWQFYYKILLLKVFGK